MTAQNTKLQETARKLGISQQALEQYMALKKAEVTPKLPLRKPIEVKAPQAQPFIR